MKAKLVILLLVLMCSSCIDKKTDFTQELSKEHLIRLELETLNISLKVPTEHTVFENNDKTVIDVNPKGRAIRQFSLTKLPPNIQKGNYKESCYFTNGAILNYTTFKEEGGNGGTEYKLEGILTFEKELFLISATDQKELGKGFPEFCLQYISTIQRLKP